MKKGFTLIELLIVVSILAILVILAINLLRGNRDKADDAATKSDLNRLKIAFEDYYADHNCYPPASYFDDASDCGSSQLSPYLNRIPCDRHTDLPYILETDQSTCSWFKFYTTLNSASSDSDAVALCNDSGSSLGNYAVSSDNVRPLVLCSTNPAPSPTPTPSSVPNPSYDPALNYYYCSSLSNCTSFDPAIYVCTPSFPSNPSCDGGTNPCQTVGTCRLR